MRSRRRVRLRTPHACRRLAVRTLDGVGVPRGRGCWPCGLVRREAPAACGEVCKRLDIATSRSAFAMSLGARGGASLAAEERSSPVTPL